MFVLLVPAALWLPPPLLLLPLLLLTVLAAAPQLRLHHHALPLALLVVGARRLLLHPRGGHIPRRHGMRVVVCLCCFRCRCRRRCRCGLLLCALSLLDVVQQPKAKREPAAAARDARAAAGQPCRQRVPLVDDAQALLLLLLLLLLLRLCGPSRCIPTP
jgi:hypothetical protein